MNDRATEDAWRWHNALHADDADWDGFTLWLEADPAHRAAYDAVAVIDATLDDQRDRLEPVIPAIPEYAAHPVTRRWGLWAGGAIAAAIALFVAVPMANRGPATQDYRTGVAQTREIALEDGSHITLGPSSHLHIAGRQQQELALEGGALFDIKHDPDRALTISAGGQQISDIGTRFDVLALPGHVRVTVAEGRVAVGPAGGSNAIELPAGRGIAIDTAAHAAEIRDVRAQDVGSWRAGRLVYNDAPLSLVAADLSRYVGREIVASPDVAARRFSGVLASGDGAELVDELGEVMGLETRADGRRLRLVARDR